MSSRSEALRAALTLALDAEREQEIVGAYERGYGEHPQETWTGELGLSLLAAAAAAEERGGKSR